MNKYVYNNYLFSLWFHKFKLSYCYKFSSYINSHDYLSSAMRETCLDVRDQFLIRWSVVRQGIHKIFIS